MEDFETFDFLLNDEDEAMLVFYQREGEPENPTIELDSANNSAVLFRNDKDSITFEGISDDIFDSLQDADKLLICELTVSEKEEDTQIAYAYEAEIRD